MPGTSRQNHRSLPNVLRRMGSELLRPFRAFLFRGLGFQGGALGYNTTPFQGLMLIFGLVRRAQVALWSAPIPALADGAAPRLGGDTRRMGVSVIHARRKADLSKSFSSFATNRRRSRTPQ